MYKVLIIVLIFSTELFAGYNNLATRLYIESKEGYSLDKLVFGINENASNYLDTALGESELPPFPPPEGIHAGFLFKDTAQNEIIMSYKDLRPFPTHLYDTVRYVLTVMKGAGDIITFKWHPLGNDIYSAVIVDKLTGGKLIFVNMKDSTEAKIDNEFIEKFELRVLYEPTTDVENPADNENLFIYPVEFTDRITINGNGSYKSYEIYNINGSLVRQGILESGYAEIDFNAAAPGIYFIAVFDDKGNKAVKKVIKN
jgi:hypothetical protein